MTRTKVKVRIFAVIILLLCSMAMTGAAFAVGAASAEPSVTPKPPPAPLGDIAVYSEAAVLMDAATGQILVGREPDKRMFPASTTKIMTAVVALEHGNLSDVVTVSQGCLDTVDADSSRVVMDVGEQFTLEQLLYGMMLVSGNDAAYMIAEHVGGTVEHFAEMMNEKAAEIGAVNTHFKNPNGLPDPEHVTTARDLAVIMCEAVKNPVFVSISSTGQYVIPPTNKKAEERRLNNTHRMIKPTPAANFPYEGVIAGKTGFTNAAGHTLVTAAQRNGRTLIAAVMQSADSPDKFVDTTALFDYGFNEFVPLTILGSDLPVLRTKAVLSDASLWMAGVTTVGELDILAHKSVKIEDIEMDCDLAPGIEDGGQVDVIIKLPGGNTSMYGELGLLPGTVQLLEEMSPAVAPGVLDPSASADGTPDASASPAGASPSPDPAEKKDAAVWIIIRNILFVIAGIFALLFLMLLVMRAVNIRRHRRRYRGRRR